MGYLHIDNLYKPTAQAILLFRTCYAMEKIHGTSSHVAWRNYPNRPGGVRFFAGGVSHDSFTALFEEPTLAACFLKLGHDRVVVFGESYGGKCQKMSHIYGRALRFVVFDVKIGDTWLCVPAAEDVAGQLGLEFVPYREVTTDLVALDAERDAPSEQARRNGVAGDAMREGVVLRPLREFTDSRGQRVMAKHKRAEFAERRTPPKSAAASLVVLETAEAIVLEWVTDMRLTHVLDKLGNPGLREATGSVVRAMIDDVCREAGDEIVQNPVVKRAIGRAAAQFFHRRLDTLLREANA